MGDAEKQPLLNEASADTDYATAADNTADNGEGNEVFI